VIDGCDFSPQSFSATSEGGVYVVNNGMAFVSLQTGGVCEAGRQRTVGASDSSSSVKLMAADCVVGLEGKSAGCGYNKGCGSQYNSSFFHTNFAF